MSLDRKDIRAKLDPDKHAQLRAICEIDGIDMGDFIEAILVPVIEKRVHDAIELATRLQRAGIAENLREQPGKAGSARE
jgi:hypothetical protein